MDMKSFQKSCGRVLAVFTLSLCAAASADETLSTNVTLTADADWRSKGTVTINPGVTVNLNGHTLTVAGFDGSGSGTITGSLVDLTRPDGAFSTTTPFDSGVVGRVFNDKPSNDDGGRIDVKPRDLPLVIDYDFGEGNEKIVNAYKVYCHPNASLPGRCPKTWYFYGSNDGKSWTKLDSRLSETGWSSSLECRTKTFANTTAYRHYRIEFTANNGDGDTLQITQLEYFSPATLCVDIPEGVTVDNQSVVISDGVQLVKKGAGTFVASRVGQTYFGGTHVVAGTFRCGAGEVANELGVAPNVVVEKDAVFDVNGWRNISTCGITLAGGTLTNTGYDFGSEDAQISKLTLTADSYVTAPHYLGLIAANSGVALLDLGGHTLDLSIGSKFRFSNTEALSPGTIRVSGEKNTAHLVFFGGMSRLQPVNLVQTNPFVLYNYTTVTIGDLRLVSNVGMVCDDLPNGFKVCGTLALPNDAYTNMELQDGSTLDLSGRTGALNVASQLANQRLTFAQDATVTLDLGDRRPKSGEMVLEWDEKPAGLQPSQFKVEANGRSYRVNLSDKGLYLSSGLMILVK